MAGGGKALVCDGILYGGFLNWGSPIAEMSMSMANYNMSPYLDWLVVWNMNFIVPYIGNFIIPTEELIFFRRVGIPPTRNIVQPCPTSQPLIDNV